MTGPVSDERQLRPTLFLDRSTVEKVLSFDEVLTAVRESYIALAKGDAHLFPLVREALGDGFFGLRSATWAGRGLLGLKVSGYRAANRQRGMDAHQACIVLVDADDSRPSAIVDGNFVTWIRTAAAGLAGTLALARDDARHVLVVGNGQQAEAQAVSHSWGLADREPKISIHPPRDDAAGSKAREFIERLERRGISVSPAPDLADAVSHADIIVTTTTSVEPFIEADWLRPGTHITAIGSDAPGKRELHADVLASAHVVADDSSQALKFGEAQYFRTEPDQPLPGLGDVLAGTVPGRLQSDQLTVFDCTGIALHDLITADIARRNAAATGAGVLVHLE